MDKSEWQGGQGESWAKNWRRTDRSFGILTDRLLAQLRGLTLHQVLDVGCGAGELSLAIARNRPDTRVLGLDVSPQLIGAARSRSEQHPNVAFVCEDAASWQAEEGFAPDLLVSRHGVMFFSDPPAAFANLAAAAAPSARFVFSCFRDPSLNPFMTEVMRLFPEPPQQRDPRAPGPFAFAEAAYVEQVLGAGGWRDVSLEAVDFPMVVGAGEDPIADAVGYFSTIGPAARMLAEMDEAGRSTFLAAVAALAERNCREGIVSLPAAAWLVTAQRA